MAVETSQIQPEQLALVHKLSFTLLYAMSNAYLVRSVTAHKHKNHATLFLFTLVCAIGGSFFTYFVLNKLHSIFTSHDLAIYALGYGLVASFFPAGSSRIAESLFNTVDAISKANSLFAFLHYCQSTSSLLALEKTTDTMTMIGHTFLCLIYCKGGGMMFSIATHGEIKPGMEHILLIGLNLCLLYLSETALLSSFEKQVYWACCFVLVSNRFVWSLLPSASYGSESTTSSPVKSPRSSKSKSPIKKTRFQLDEEDKSDKDQDRPRPEESITSDSESPIITLKRRTSSSSTLVQDTLASVEQVPTSPQPKRRGRPRKTPIVKE